MNIEFIGMACALGLSAMGSAFGSGFAAQASVGAWKKCYANGKPAPFIMVAFSGAPPVSYTHLTLPTILLV